MSRNSTLDSRLKKIRKELSLIDKDLKNLAHAASGPVAGASMPRIKSKELRERQAERSVAESPKGSGGGNLGRPAKPAQRAPVLQPKGSLQADKDGRFVEYLSSSFGSGAPLGQERRIQRNKAILMLVIVLLILFLVLYRVMV